MSVRVSSSLLERLPRSHSDVFGRFKSFTALLESIYSLTLPVPALTDYAGLKYFCQGLLEGDLSHPWKSAVARLSARDRFGLAHSLFLFRKIIPQEKPSLVDFVRKMAQEQAPLDPDFVDFARRSVRRMFRTGWDRSYVRISALSCLSTSSCYEAGRSAGGGRGVDSMRRELRSEFCEYVLTGYNMRPRGASRVQAVESGGKWRIITIPPRVDNALRPLHKAMYSHLSHFDWLLRGEAKPRRFKHFTPMEGEVFVSGDYESATDNLNLDLQRVLMEELLATSTTVPEGIKEHALSTFESMMDCDGSMYLQRRGQLMGNLTSFPLLCLVNYITFRYSIRRPVPVKINGDDIVFRATPDEVTRWESNVAKGGLVLSKGKTLKSSRFFTLNSTPFVSGRKPDVVGFVRPKALWPLQHKAEQVLSMNSRFYSFAVGYGRLRMRTARTFFVHQSTDALMASRRSLTRGLGLSVDQEMLRSSGMWHRELFYLEQSLEQPLPVLVKGGIPDGFVQVSKYLIPPDLVREEEVKFRDALVSYSWREPYDPTKFCWDRVLDSIHMGCSPYGLGRLMCSRVLRMLRLSRAQAWRWVYSRSNEDVFGRKKWSKGENVWVSVDVINSIRLSTYNFVQAIG